MTIAAALARLSELHDAWKNTLSKNEAGTPQDASSRRSLPSGELLKKLLNGGPEANAELRQEALQIAAKDPSTAAVILRTWLEQEGLSASAHKARSNRGENDGRSTRTPSPISRSKSRAHAAFDSRSIASPRSE